MVHSTIDDIKEKDNVIGWIILTVVLLVIIIIFFILWILCWVQNPQPCKCFGSYGVEFNVNTVPLNVCGPSRSAPCEFIFGSANDAVKQCESLRDICKAFTYDTITNQMRIVNPTNTIFSASSTLYTRQ